MSRTETSRSRSPEDALFPGAESPPRPPPTNACTCLHTHTHVQQVSSKHRWGQHRAPGTEEAGGVTLPSFRREIPDPGCPLLHAQPRRRLDLEGPPQTALLGEKACCSHSLTISGVKELVAFQCPFGLELLATHVTQVGLLSAVTIHVSLEVALATSCVLTQGTLEGLYTCQRRKKQRDEHRYSCIRVCI